jgi:prephenate dehydratase
MTVNDSTTEHTPIPRVAFQGTFGAFSEQAIRQHWPDGADALPHHTFDDVVASVIAREVDFAVIPVENAIAGPVVNAIEALDAAGDAIVRDGDLRINVKLCLMGPSGASIDGVRAVHSHPMALAQCRKFFARHAWLTPVVHEDTAGAAQEVAMWNDLTIAAIASNAAAVRHQLQVIAESLEDDPANWTRFVVVSAR